MFGWGSWGVYVVLMGLAWGNLKAFAEPMDYEAALSLAESAQQSPRVAFDKAKESFESEHASQSAAVAVFFHLKEHAKDELLWIHNEALDNDNHFFARMQLVNLMGQIGDSSSIEPLLDLLFYDEESLVRAAAKDALTRYSFPLVLDALPSQLKNKELPLTQVFAKRVEVKQVKQTEKQLIVDWMTQVIQSDRAKVVVLHALKKIGDPGVCARILGFVEKGAYSLVQLELSETVASLIQASRTPKQFAHCLAVAAPLIDSEYFTIASEVKKAYDQARKFRGEHFFQKSLLVLFDQIEAIDDLTRSWLSAQLSSKRVMKILERANTPPNGLARLIQAHPNRKEFSKKLFKWVLDFRPRSHIWEHFVANAFVDQTMERVRLNETKGLRWLRHVPYAQWSPLAKTRVDQIFDGVRDVSFRMFPRLVFMAESDYVLNRFAKYYRALTPKDRQKLLARLDRSGSAHSSELERIYEATLPSFERADLEGAGDLACHRLCQLRKHLQEFTPPVEYLRGRVQWLFATESLRRLFLIKSAPYCQKTADLDLSNYLALWKRTGLHHQLDRPSTDKWFFTVAGLYAPALGTLLLKEVFRQMKEKQKEIPEEWLQLQKQLVRLHNGIQKDSRWRTDFNRIGTNASGSTTYWILTNFLALHDMDGIRTDSEIEDSIRTWKGGRVGYRYKNLPEKRASSGRLALNQWAYLSQFDWHDERKIPDQYFLDLLTLVGYEPSKPARKLNRGQMQMFQGQATRWGFHLPGGESFGSHYSDTNLAYSASMLLLMHELRAKNPRSGHEISTRLYDRFRRKRLKAFGSDGFPSIPNLEGSTHWTGPRSTSRWAYPFAGLGLLPLLEDSCTTDRGLARSSGIIDHQLFQRVLDRLGS